MRQIERPSKCERRNKVCFARKVLVREGKDGLGLFCPRVSCVRTAKKIEARGESKGDGREKKNIYERSTLRENKRKRGRCCSVSVIGHGNIVN